jgi:signal transduction histidine kinase
MSYRTIKRLLGETSLERKCRFLFGGGLLLLLTGSFYLYASLNKDIVYAQNDIRARDLMKSILMKVHWKWSEADPRVQPMIDDLFSELNPEDIEGYSYQPIRADWMDADSADRPDDTFGHEALEKIQQGAAEHIERVTERGEYHYYGAVRATKTCVSCHKIRNPRVKQAGDLIGMVKISLPLDKTKRALNENNAYLLATGIVTAFLAIWALYAIVRYVIVKPVLHLKDVSDDIARGNLDLRADIRTGDEFEELSHAFNRMLRHLVTVQDELREVNTDLDAKVDDLAQVNLRLYEMNKLKDDFLATMSHELRTPLNSILGFSDVLAGADNLSEKQRRFVSNIQTSGKSLTALINDVLDLAKIESGKMELQVVELSLADLVEQQVATLMALAERKNIDLTPQIEEGMPVLLQDAGKLRQILNNLLSNAIKFTPEGGRVRVRAGLCDEKTVELVVEDTGIGIPLEEQETIFEKFRQGKTIPGQREVMTRQFGGTGLGLSIVKELSKLLGGEVLLDSEFGKGSSFTVRLPVHIDELPKRLDDDLRINTLGIEALLTEGLRTAEEIASHAVDADGEDQDESAA